MAQKLKKLQLKKTEIANLNDEQMFKIQGGSTMICGYTIAVSIATISATVSITYDYGGDASWWNCDDDNMTASERMINGNCYLPTAHVYSIYTVVIP